MSVRLRKWKDKEARVQETWIVDVKYKHADGTVQAVRQTSPIQTRRGAEQHERQLRESLQNGTYGKEVSEVPTLSNFKERFPSTPTTTTNQARSSPSAWHSKITSSPCSGTLASTKSWRPKSRRTRRASCARGCRRRPSTTILPSFANCST